MSNQIALKRKASHKRKELIMKKQRHIKEAEMILLLMKKMDTNQLNNLLILEV